MLKNNYSDYLLYGLKVYFIQYYYYLYNNLLRNAFYGMSEGNGIVFLFAYTIIILY